MFNPTDKVTVSIPQLHGKISVMESGEVVSVQGDKATIMLAGEDIPRIVPLDRLQQTEELYGAMTDRPNDTPVIDAIRR